MTRPDLEKPLWEMSYEERRAAFAKPHLNRCALHPQATLRRPDVGSADVCPECGERICHRCGKADAGAWMSGVCDDCYGIREWGLADDQRLSEERRWNDLRERAEQAEAEVTRLREENARAMECFDRDQRVIAELQEANGRLRAQVASVEALCELDSDSLWLRKGSKIRRFQTQCRGYTVTESWVRVDDIRAALAGTDEAALAAKYARDIGEDQTVAERRERALRHAQSLDGTEEET